MGQYNWFIAALGAAILWGGSYAVSEKILRLGVTPAGLLVFNGLFAVVVYGAVTAYQGGYGHTLKMIQDNPTTFWWLLTVVALNVTGNFLIFYSVGAKNATLASLIEISYPLFTIFFVWLLFKQVHLNWTIAFGGLLILSGIGFVFWGSEHMAKPTEDEEVPPMLIPKP